MQVIVGALLLANRFVPLAPEGLPIALIATGLWTILFYAERSAFAGVFVHRVQA